MGRLGWMLLALATASCERTEEKRETLRFRSHDEASDAARRPDPGPDASLPRLLGEVEVDKASVRKRLVDAGYSIVTEYDSDAGVTRVVTFAVSKPGSTASGIVCLYEFETEKTATMAKEAIAKSFSVRQFGKTLVMAYDSADAGTSESMLSAAIGS